MMIRFYSFNEISLLSVPDRTLTLLFLYSKEKQHKGTTGTAKMFDLQDKTKEAALYSNMH